MLKCRIMALRALNYQKFWAQCKAPHLSSVRNFANGNQQRRPNVPQYQVLNAWCSPISRNVIVTPLGARNFSVSSITYQDAVQAPIPPPPAAESVPESKELVLDFLPEKPAPMLSSSDLETTIQIVGDPPFDQLGLASWWPPGRLQYAMEQLHIVLDLPWWGTIMCMTVVVRMLVFPLVVKAQNNAAKLNNHMPQLQAIQNKLTDARRRGDLYDSARLGAELSEFMKKHDINPMKNILPLLVQAPIFMSMFFALRGMANLPVESMSRGGFSWVSDLTVADPYYILPLVTASTTFLQHKLGADGMNVQQVGPIVKKVMYAMPIPIFLLTMNFPAAIAFYWATTNIISVCQARLIRLDAVRTKLGVPKMKNWTKDKLPAQQKGFRESIRESVDNWKVQAEIADRRAYDEQAFRDAGVGKPVRTYKFDPTKTWKPPKK